MTDDGRTEVAVLSLTDKALAKVLELRRHFGPDICVETKISNLRILGADAKPFIERAVTLGRRGITMYIQPVPRPELFVSSKGSIA